MSGILDCIGGKFNHLVKNERGQGLVEYALILSLIAVVVILAVTNIGTRANTAFTTIAAALLP